jgi:hypothetical protein
VLPNPFIRDHQDSWIRSAVLGKSDNGLEQRYADGAGNFTDYLRRMDYADTVSSGVVQDYIQIGRKRRRRVRKSTSSHLLLWRGYSSYMVWNLWTAFRNVTHYNGSNHRSTHGSRVHRHLIGRNAQKRIRPRIRHLFIHCCQHFWDHFLVRIQSSNYEFIIWSGVRRRLHCFGSLLDDKRISLVGHSQSIYSLEWL